MLFFALLLALLIGFVVGGVIGFVLGYDKATADYVRQPTDMRVEVVKPTTEDLERLGQYYAAWREDLDNPEG